MPELRKLIFCIWHLSEVRESARPVNGFVVSFSTLEPDRDQKTTRLTSNFDSCFSKTFKENLQEKDQCISWNWWEEKCWYPTKPHYILLDLHTFVFFISASRDPHINKFNNYFTMETTQASERKKDNTLNYYKPSIPASTNNFTFNAIHTNRRNWVVMFRQRCNVFQTLKAPTKTPNVNIPRITSKD